MGLFYRFRALPLERKLLVVFIGICVALPFGMVHSPLEVASYSVPLWVYFHGAVGFWCASGKPLWQASLACYGISSVEILGIYFGIFGFRLLLVKGLNRLKERLEKGLKIPFKNRSLFLKKEVGYHKFNSFTEDKKRKFVKWLGRQSIWIVLLFLFLPLPATDVLAAATLGAKGLKYGHWYLVAINLPHIFLLVFLLYRGVDFFFL